MTFFFFNVDLFICFWLRRVFVAVWGFSLIVASGGYSLAVVCRLPLLQSTGSREPQAWAVAARELRSCGSWTPEHKLNSCDIQASLAFPGGGSGKEPTYQCRRHEMWVQSLSQEDPLVEGMAVLCCLVTQLCATPWAVVGVLQASILKWVAMPSSRRSSQPGDQTRSSHCRWILYCLSHQESPLILEWVAYPFCRGSSWPRNRTGVSCIAGRFFTTESPGEPLRCPFKLHAIEQKKGVGKWRWREVEGGNNKFNPKVRSAHRWSFL